MATRLVHATHRTPAPLAAAVITCLALALATVGHAGPAASRSAQTPGNRWLTELRVMNFAHGGGLHEAPQGTLYAYETALDRGANALEMDLHITRDGHVVAIHDSTVDRTTDGSGCVATKTLAELKALDAAHTFVPDRGPVGGLDPAEYPFRGVATGATPPPPGFTAADFTIATLEEIFLAEPDALMLMELKPTEVYQDHDCPALVAALPPDQRPDLAAEVARLIDAYDMTDQVMVASFIDDLLHRFMALAPGVDTSFPLGESIAVYGAYLAGEPLPNPRGHEAMQVPRSYGGIEITEEVVAYARANGVAVHFWTINDPDEMALLLGWGVDGIITDRPAVLAELLPDPVDPPAPQPTRPGAGPTAPGPSTTTTAAPTPTPTTVGSPAPGSPESTTTAPGPDTTTAPGSGNPGGSSRPAVGGRTQSSGTAGPLPRTGVDLRPTATAVAMVLAGGALLAARNRRRPTPTR